jgi:hypothetical protein
MLIVTDDEAVAKLAWNLRRQRTLKYRLGRAASGKSRESLRKLTSREGTRWTLQTADRYGVKKAPSEIEFLASERSVEEREYEERMWA